MSLPKKIKLENCVPDATRQDHIHHLPTDEVFSVDAETYAKVLEFAPIADNEDFKDELPDDTEGLSASELAATDPKIARLLDEAKELGVTVDASKPLTENALKALVAVAKGKRTKEAKAKAIADAAHTAQENAHASE